MWPTDPIEQEKLARDFVLGRSEHQRVDLKSALYLEQKRAVVEMVRDISALANTDEDWGYIVIGAERGRVVGNVDCLSDTNLEQTSEKLSQVAHNYLDPVPRFRLVPLRDPDPAIGAWGVIVIEPSTDQPYMFVRGFSDEKDKPVFRSGDWYVRRGDTTDLALPRDWARVLERRVRRALQPMELEVRSLRERVVALESRSVAEVARLRVSLQQSEVDYNEQWALKILIENPGTVAVEQLDVEVSVPERTELSRTKRKSEPVNIAALAGLMAANPEAPYVNEEARAVYGVIHLLRPGEDRVWGAGFVSLTYPGEYEVRVTIKAKNLSVPLDERLTLTVGY